MLNQSFSIYDKAINKVSAIGAYEDLLRYREQTFQADSNDSIAEWEEPAAIDLNKIVPMPEKPMFDIGYLEEFLECCVNSDDSIFCQAMGPEWQRQAEALGYGCELAQFVGNNPDSDFTVAALQLLNSPDPSIKSEVWSLWMRDNWGSMTNSGNRKCGPIVAIDDNKDRFSLTCTFDTDWRSPMDAYRQLIHDWPELDFRIVELSHGCERGSRLIGSSGVMVAQEYIDLLDVHVQEFGYIPQPDKPYGYGNYSEDGKLAYPYSKFGLCEKVSDLFLAHTHRNIESNSPCVQDASADWVPTRNNPGLQQAG